MPIVEGVGFDAGSMYLKRKIFVRDKDGVEHEIRLKAQLDAIIAQMSPEQYETFKINYRFAPIINMTGNINYTGTERDL